MRYRLQRRETLVRPNVLGNHSMPVHSYRWKDVACSDDREALVEMAAGREHYRIEDTQPEVGAGKESGT